MAAEVALYGMSPMEFLTTRNSFKARVMHSIAARAHQLRVIEQRNQAALIIEALAKAMPK